MYWEVRTLADRIKDAFDGVRAEDGLKAKTRTFLAEQIYAKAQAKPAVRQQMIAVLACLLLVLFGGGGYSVYFTPASAISVDVNPSIELSINRFGRVISVQGYNTDGERLAASVDLHNMVYTDALEKLMASDAMEVYLDADAMVSITVIGATDAESETMRSRIAACGYARRGNVECGCGNREMTSAAHEAGLSFGKYRAFLELNALDPTVTVQDVQGLSMREIRNWILELSKSQQGESGQKENGGNGYGYGGWKWRNDQ